MESPNNSAMTPSLTDELRWIHFDKHIFKPTKMSTPARPSFR